jgi:hypothetical protein
MLRAGSSLRVIRESRAAGFELELEKRTRGLCESSAEC